MSANLNFWWLEGILSREKRLKCVNIINDVKTANSLIFLPPADYYLVAIIYFPLASMYFSKQLCYQNLYLQKNTKYPSVKLFTP